MGFNHWIDTGKNSDLQNVLQLPSRLLLVFSSLVMVFVHIYSGTILCSFGYAYWMFLKCTFHLRVCTSLSDDHHRNCMTFCLYSKGIRRWKRTLKSLRPNQTVLKCVSWELEGSIWILRVLRYGASNIPSECAFFLLNSILWQHITININNSKQHIYDTKVS